MDTLTVFKFREHTPVRVIDRDGNPWFVAADVCKALAISNPWDAVSRLDDDEVSNLAFSDVGKNGRTIPRKLNIVSESGLYALVIRSNKPEARAFRKWITAEVLPTIRKSGHYIPDDKIVDVRPSTTKMVESLARRISNGEVIPRHILDFARSIADMVGIKLPPPLFSHFLDDGGESEATDIFKSTFEICPKDEAIPRREVYRVYCEKCAAEEKTPDSPRRFWPLARKKVKFNDVRRCDGRYVVIERV